MNNNKARTKKETRTKKQNLDTFQNRRLVNKRCIATLNLDQIKVVSNNKARNKPNKARNKPHKARTEQLNEYNLCLMKGMSWETFLKDRSQ